VYEAWLVKENLLTGWLRGGKKTENIEPIFLCASSSQRERRKRNVCVCGTREFLPPL
jgi:hypothetical protein